MCFIEFLNEYNGAFTVLLTLVLVIINIYMGWQNYVLRGDATKPKVLANICVKNGNICYKFTNFGAYPATNIQIKIDPYLIEQKQNGKTKIGKIRNWFLFFGFRKRIDYFHRDDVE